VLETCLADNRQAWELRSDGTYTQRTPGDESERAIHRLLLRDPYGVEGFDRAPARTPEASRAANGG
jgi:polyphosphate kinase